MPTLQLESAGIQHAKADNLGLAFTLVTAPSQVVGLLFNISFLHQQVT